METPPSSLSITRQDLASLFRCKACSLPLREPVSVACGNTLCRACLPPLSEVEAPMRRLVCPAQCEHGVHYYNNLDLKTDVTVSKLLEMVERESDSERLQSDILRELDCQLCYQLLHEPTTTPCGHTLCRLCLFRSLDHSSLCPTCRYSLPGYSFFHHHSPSKLLTTLLTMLLPNRVPSPSPLPAEDNPMVPLFICTLVFPKQHCSLHVFEPRYRLMIRRCVETGRNQFGMVLPGATDGEEHVTYGTMLEIGSIQYLPDGRALVDTVGSYRFRVVERGECDGYAVGRIQRVEDISMEEEMELERLALATHPARDSNELTTTATLNGDEQDAGREHTLDELVAIAREFLRDLSEGAYTSILYRRMIDEYGEVPDNPADFSFWCGSALFLDEYIKYQLLPITSVRQRMKLIIGWIHQLQRQWWYRGCTIA
ncbi:uncharacterized protein VTP21DRAFT_5384 [Calcarisporiella thermophila]|uniref:uncharacterized protein n=1 Tax=Calcarisporiella thermophila TaxID=911321 RepID=UPI0037425195